MIQGLLQIGATEILSKEGVAPLLAHEATRVFHDRLVDAQDRVLFYKLLSEELHNFFKASHFL